MQTCSELWRRGLALLTSPFQQMSTLHEHIAAKVRVLLPCYIIMHLHKKTGSCSWNMTPIRSDFAYSVGSVCVVGVVIT